MGVTTYRVEIKAGETPTVCVDIEQDDPPTLAEVVEALDDLTNELEMEGYLAEYIRDTAWQVVEVERYDGADITSLPDVVAELSLAEVQ